MLFHGTKDTLICGRYGKDPWLLSGRTPAVRPSMREVELSHEMDWVRAWNSRVPTVGSNWCPGFKEAGPFNEMVVMGVLAVRLQGLNKELEWDGKGCPSHVHRASYMIKTVIEDGFEIHDGHPTFDKTWTDEMSARQYAAELIKHTYREGWSLPRRPA